MVPFAGYNMPVQYEGILAEVNAVRTASGIFDVSHMGRFWLEGPDARRLMDWVHTGNISESMPTGRARYGHLCNENGGVIDDAIIYRLAAERFMIVANAANATKVHAWLNCWRNEAFPDSILHDGTADFAMIALQGPAAMQIASELQICTPAAIKPFHVLETTVLGKPALVARTGYTGEDGIEIMPSSSAAVELWHSLERAGAYPCGLGARDTLRLEAGLLLHGSDMDESVNPIEAGSQRFVHLERDFCGAGPIRSAIENGTQRSLVGFMTEGRGPIPRPHADILSNQAVVGQVTSGGYSPSLDTNIGLGYVQTVLTDSTDQVHIDVRGRLVTAAIVKPPFYSRSR